MYEQINILNPHELPSITSCSSQQPVITVVSALLWVLTEMLCASVFQGASILLMLKASLPGDGQFRKGIIQYLNQFSGLNTDTNDLWNSLTQVGLPFCFVPPFWRKLLLSTLPVNFAAMKLCSCFTVLSTCNRAFGTLKPWPFETRVKVEFFGRFWFQRLRVDRATANISTAYVRAERVPL